MNDPSQSLMDVLGMRFRQLTADEVVVTMPITSRTHQPYGMLHGGASVALAETAASIGTAAQLDLTREMAVGLEINANHVKAKRDGEVTARAVPVHRGRRTWVWDVRITDEQQQLICIARCTVAIVPKPPGVTIEWPGWSDLTAGPDSAGHQ